MVAIVSSQHKAMQVMKINMWCIYYRCYTVCCKLVFYTLKKNNNPKFQVGARLHVLHRDKNNIDFQSNIDILHFHFSCKLYTV